MFNANANVNANRKGAAAFVSHEGGGALSSGGTPAHKPFPPATAQDGRQAVINAVVRRKAEKRKANILGSALSSET